MKRHVNSWSEARSRVALRGSTLFTKRYVRGPLGVPLSQARGRLLQDPVVGAAGLPLTGVALAPGERSADGRF